MLSPILRSCELSLSEHLTICLIEVFRAKEVIGTENPADSNFFRTSAIDLLYKAAGTSIRTENTLSAKIGKSPFEMKSLIALYQNEYLNDMATGPGRSSFRLKSRKMIGKVGLLEPEEFTNDSINGEKQDQEQLMESLIDEGLRGEKEEFRGSSQLETGNFAKLDFGKKGNEFVFEGGKSDGTWNEGSEFKYLRFIFEEII